MRPVNEKSLVHHLFEQMDKLDRDEVSIAKATVQTKLSCEVNKVFKLEQDRARLIMDLQNHAKATGNIVELRELASVAFEDTTKKR